MLSGSQFTLDTYQDDKKPLLLIKSEVFENRFSIVDYKKGVIVAVVLEFHDNHIYCQTPFTTNSIAFPIFTKDIQLIP